MDIKKYKAAIQLNLRNALGWRTNRKIVIIESDDWGSIRMPSKDTFNRLLSAGIRVDNCPYNRFDSLESEDDLSSLFEVLRKFSDINGNHPVITTNFVTANPDFEKIRQSGFEEYHYEWFPETYKRYPNHKRAFEICKQGIHERLIFPQFHGREHLNINRWMAGLRKNLPETRLAFDNELFGLSTNITSEDRRSYLAAFDFDDFKEIEDQKKILIDGLRLFQKIFEYNSESFIASNYIWHSLLEQILADSGVKFIKGAFVQIEPIRAQKPIRLINRRLGPDYKYGQIYMPRNSVFEPSLNLEPDPVTKCIKDIACAFLWRKPSIISSHRLNYIGSIVQENREENLDLLHNLLKQIIQKWPDIEFMNSSQLGEIVKSEIS